MASNKDHRKEARTRIAEYLKAHPEVSYRELGARLKCSFSTISAIAREFGIVRRRKALDISDLSQLEG